MDGHEKKWSGVNSGIEFGEVEYSGRSDWLLRVHSAAISTVW